MSERSAPKYKERKAPRPLDKARLQELAVAYVGRFATTRAKLATYLRRKIQEKGWDGPSPPDIAALVERLAELGYVDDAAFALSKARSLGQRGYGERRVDMALRQAGVGEADGAPAKDAASEDALAAAVRYAQRRRLGPFALGAPDPKGRERALAGMIRAGHGFDLARRLIDLPPDADATADSIERRLSD
jgi:regulatory protein